MDYIFTDVHRVDAKGETKGILGVFDETLSYNITAAKKKKAKTFSIGNDYYVYPGLINAHDHLLGNYFPRVGKGPYLNWLPWDNDLKAAKIYQERGKLTNYEIYFLACLKHLISGVTWVSDHIPHSVNEKYLGHLPINVIDKYTLAHECSSYDLNWGDPIPEHTLAKKENIPFITHIEEGFDEEAKKGVEYLKEWGILDDYTVMIHGVALSEEDIKDIAKAKAHLVWCPGSNVFMYNETADIKSWLKNQVNVSLGTDSPMSGSMNLLDEIQYADYCYKKMYGQNLDPRIVFSMVTKNPAKAFRIPAGTLSEGAPANFTVVKKIDNNPYENLKKIKLRDIALVVVNGKPSYGNFEFSPFLQDLKIQHWKVTVEDVSKFIAVRGSLKLLKKVKNFFGYSKYLPFLPITID